MAQPDLRKGRIVIDNYADKAPVATVPANARGLKRREAARYCGLSETTFTELYEEGYVPARQVPGKRRLVFDKRHLDGLMDSWPVMFARVREDVELIEVER